MYTCQQLSVCLICGLSLLVPALCSSTTRTPVLYPFGEDAGDESLEGANDATWTMTLNQNIPLFGNTYDNMTISENGIVYFGEDEGMAALSGDNDAINLTTLSVPVFFPLWTDFDMSLGRGKMYYREVLRGPILPRVTFDIRAGIFNNSDHEYSDFDDPIHDFSVSYLIVITWYKGTYWSGTDDTPTNTIQLVFASDLNRTYAMFIYDTLEWVRIGRIARVGYYGGGEMLAPNTDLYEHADSMRPELMQIYNISNVNVDGRIMFQIDSPCGPNSCEWANAVCLGDGYCLCYDGFDEDTGCTDNIDDCGGTPCSGNGVCSDYVDHFECTCDPGWLGEICDTETVECEPDICQHGTCIEEHLDYSCDCDYDYTGTHCEVKINECLSCPCQSGLCEELNGTYACNCDDGFTGFHCETDIDDCVDHNCTEHGVCVDSIAHYICFCHPGYTGDFCSVEKNECDTSPCANGTCIDKVNGYTCSCYEGYAGRLCDEDIDECASNPCIYGTCNDGVDSYLCSCDEGFSGVRCEEDLENCLPNICPPNAYCEDLTPGYECVCLPGYTGVECVTSIDDCVAGACVYGTCIDGDNSYYCACDEGYRGESCEESIDSCQMPCLNGDCVPFEDGFMCLCHEGFTGEICEESMGSCSPEICKNGLCRDGLGTYYCECIPGYRGTHCDYCVNECDSSPCRNEGSCKDFVNGYVCLCPDGVTGIHCETDLRPAIGTWGEWNVWYFCSKACDIGTQRRFRQCLRTPCSDVNSEIQLCNTHPCEDYVEEEDENFMLLMETLKTKYEFVEDETAFKERLAESLNNLCRVQRQTCCRLIEISVPMYLSNEFDVFEASDVVLSPGKPVDVSDINIRLKVYVNTTRTELRTACGQPVILPTDEPTPPPLPPTEPPALTTTIPTTVGPTPPAPTTRQPTEPPPPTTRQPTTEPPPPTTRQPTTAPAPTTRQPTQGPEPLYEFPEDVRVPRKILQQAATHALDTINKENCCWSIVVEQSETTLSYILMGILIPLGVGLVMVGLVVMCFRTKMCSMSPESNDKPMLSDPVDPGVDETDMGQQRAMIAYRYPATRQPLRNEHF